MRAHDSGTRLTKASAPSVDLDASSASFADSILFYDGLCVLCDGFAGFVARRDRHGRFRFEPLQDEVARSLISDDASAVSRDSKGRAGSVVLWENRTAHRKSEAVLRVIEGLGGAWKVCAFFLRLTPRFARDAAYDLVARNRSRWFGRRGSCRIF